MSRDSISKDPAPRAARKDGVDRFLETAIHMFPTLHPETEAAVDRMSWIVKHLDRVSDRTVSAYGLNVGEFKLLLKLRKVPTGRMAAGELASLLNLSSGAMTNRLDGLEEAGYITRNRDLEDRRSVIAEITQAGIEVLAKAVEAQGREEEDLLSVLKADEQRRLNALLRRLILEIERREA
jgi:DNA-binding MarR family transcriptional regulator